MIINELVKLLEKYYINYKPSKWKNIKSIDDFKKRWGKEHGGYISPEEMDIYKKTSKRKEEIQNKDYPKIKYVQIDNKKIKAIWIPTAVYNNIDNQKKYIKKANDLILENFKDTDTITIDLNYNFGGKDTVMMAALSPIFNMSKRKNLVTVKTNTKTIKGLFKIDNGKYGSTSNPIVYGSKKKLQNIQNINIIMGETFSAGEVIAIAFKSMSDQFNITFYGYKTGGATTYIKQFNLSNGGAIELPIGYMVDSFENVYYDGVDL